MFEIKRYTPAAADEWNSFVERSKNGTFLLDRHYMDYHSKRFTDHSLMFYRDGELFALLPANAEGDTLFSHHGLTYGGLVMSQQCTAAKVQQLFRELNEHLAEHHFAHVVYKTIPHIYHRTPAEEDWYSLFSVCRAQLIDRSISSTIDLSQPLKWHRDRRYGVNKAFANGVSVSQSDDWEAFWQVLSGNLLRKYGAKPVHTLQEIQLLHSRFPHQILLFTATKDGVVLGGTVIYVTPTVIHAQYISASEEGKRLRVVDALFDYLINNHPWSSRYFDLGTSNGTDGHILVEPLVYQKEGFGGRAVCYDHYRWDL